MPADNRRTFLKTVGVTAGALSLTGTGVVLAQQDEESDDTDSADSDDSSNDTQIKTTAWSTHRGGAGRTGSTTEDGPGPDVTTDWSTALNGSMWTNEPVIVDGVLYLAVATTSDESETTGYIVAYDLETGEEKWRRDDIPEPKTPTVGDGMVFFATVTRDYPSNDDGGLFGLDAETGETVWHDVGPYEWTNPVLVDGRLFVVQPPQQYVLELDPETGERKHTEIDQKIATEPSYEDGTLFFRQGVAMDSDDWSKTWEISDENFDFRLDAVNNGYVYGIRDGQYGIAVQARSAEDASVEWAMRPGVNDDDYGRLAVTDDYVFFSSSNDDDPDQIDAFDAKTGELVWSNEYEMEITSDLTVSNGTLYVSGRTGTESKTGDAVVLALDAATNDERWRYTFGSTDSEDVGPAASTSVVADGKLYTSTFPAGTDTDARYVKDSTFYALGADDGSDDDSDDKSPEACIEATPSLDSRDLEAGDTVHLETCSTCYTDEGPTHEWDTDGDGDYDETGHSVDVAVPRCGSLKVTLRVTDADGDSDTERVEISAS
ncbi:PQQ-binding-like beta-propeller repeat protein [Haladaptatus sp. DYF46]|uniref:outer membrane protein assembly factor BamB family protein n=1 Tax=Haladaptatus sp. DYF46 TaxID=2886041 RepID=UPI001E36B7C5|nr:PQQ-binding-like beta-propeller repeat protein [Haladaptatus sp. DYF46]